MLEAVGDPYARPGVVVVPVFLESTGLWKKETPPPAAAEMDLCTTTERSELLGIDLISPAEYP